MIICRLTFLELLMVVGVILILFVLIAPMVVIPHRPREKARQVNCKANLKQIGLALYIYSEENDGFFPITPDGTNFEPLNVQELLRDSKVYGCPSSEKLLTLARHSNYLYIGSGFKNDHDSAVIAPLAGDRSGNHPGNAWMNVLFTDVHVEGARPDGSKTWNQYPLPKVESIVKNTDEK